MSNDFGSIQNELFPADLLHKETQENHEQKMMIKY
jgi:hypothetical protein